MTTEEIIFTDIVSATVHADNSADENRVFSIAADAQIEGGRLTAVVNGTVTRADSGRYLGSFDRRRDGSLRLDLQEPDADRVAALEAIMAFNATLRQKADTASPLTL